MGETDATVVEPLDTARSVVAADHLAVGYLIAYTVSGFIRIVSPIADFRRLKLGLADQIRRRRRRRRRRRDSVGTAAEVVVDPRRKRVLRSGRWPRQLRRGGRRRRGSRVRVERRGSVVEIRVGRQLKVRRFQSSQRRREIGGGGGG